MPRKSLYSVDDMRDAVRDSTSFAQVLSKLGLRPAGGNYKHLKTRLAALGIDFSHFTHQGWANDRALGPRRPLSDYLANPSVQKISSFALKQRLIREGLLVPRCASCQLEQWQGLPIALELDHINGHNRDNRLENLRLLCPNCHAMTDTYRGRNKRRLAAESASLDRS